MPISFERDFGYLSRFFDGLAVHAGTLQDRSAAARLLALLKEEKARWEEIKGLLGGASAPAAAAGAKPEPAMASEADQPAPSPEKLTVGSLISR